MLKIRNLARLSLPDLLFLVVGKESLQVNDNLIFMMVELDFGDVGGGHFL